MAAAFETNKSKIQAVLERNLAIVVPRLHSVGLISDEDRDLALNASIDSSTRAASLTSTIESKMVNYRNWWILVYVLLSSGLDADKTFFESLVVSPDLYLDVEELVAHGGVLEDPATSSSLIQESYITISAMDRAEATSSSPHTPLQEATLIGSEDETATLPSTPTAAPSLSESEPMVTQEDSAVYPSDVKISSVWYTHAKKYPGIKFSNYYTKQTVTYRGGIIKGEGIELQIPGHAIKREDSVEFTIQGCIDGPFELPEDISFASPVFVITPHYQFEREVTLWEDIYVHLQSYEDYKEVVFLTSPSKPELDDDGPHWNFQISQSKPQCNAQSRRVWMQVKQFCLFCFGIKRRAPQYQYRVCLYSPLTAVDSIWRAVFSVSLYHEVFIKNLKVYLESFPYKFCETCETPQHLTEEQIVLRLPEATNVNMGYKIVADKTPCIILKSAVDIPCLSWRHKRRAIKDKGGYPPRITLTVTYTKSFEQATVCELGIVGVSDTLKTFNMTIPSDSLPTTSALILPYRSITISQSDEGNHLYDHHLTIRKLLHLPLSTYQEFVNIPREIGYRSRFLRYVLGLKTSVPVGIHAGSPLIVQSEAATGEDCVHHHPKECLRLGEDDLHWISQEQTRPSCLVDPELAEQSNRCIFKEWIESYSYPKVSWNSLADALLKIDIYDDFVHSLRSCSCPLTMSSLLHFPVTKVVTANIPREVGIKYFDFGTHLLQEVTGAHIRTLELELNQNGERINQRILQEWLSGGGRPVTWATLVEVLNIIDMGELAKKIKDKYITGTVN